MRLDKGTSEGHFIAVIYNHFYKEEMTREQMEKLARLALSLHKAYWRLCEREELVANSSCETVS